MPFKGGGEATAAILGGHVTVGTSGLAELEEYIKNGNMRALAVTSPVRLPGNAIPTLQEQGFNVVIGNWRGVYGAAGITPAQRQALIDGVTKASKTKTWQETLSHNRWTSTLLTGDDFARFVDDDTARMRTLMLKLGMI